MGVLEQGILLSFSITKIKMIMVDHYHDDYIDCILENVLQFDSPKDFLQMKIFGRLWIFRKSLVPKTCSNVIIYHTPPF